ncbi:MAG: hypothetical protein QOG82_2754 [Actinomycetota bacterium]|jgi:predicted nucleic acid-binding Zn ribbon protein|nr:hypothetical protein [Actinomycetota bacterium]
MTWRPLKKAGRDIAPRKLADSLPGVARRIGGPDGAAFVHLASTWSDIVGPAVAAHSRPLRLATGTLVIAVDQAGWVTELTYLEASLRARIDDAVGPGVVQVVKVTIRPK